MFRAANRYPPPIEPGAGFRRNMRGRRREEMIMFATLRRRTAPQLLAERARATPDVVAFRSKHLGVYRQRTWRDYAGLVAQCALGLRELGLQPGGRVAIMGDPCEEWMIADLAAQSAGAVTYGIYPTSSVSELAFLMNDGGAGILIAEDQEYVDKILSVADRLPALRWIVVIDHSAMFGYHHPKLKRYADVIALGKAADPLAALEDMARALDPAAPAFIIYTSGTTGNPKGAVIAHGKHLASAYTVLDHYPTLLQHDHRTVVFLPLCHIFGRDLAITVPLLSRLVPHFGEDSEDLPATLFEVAPTVLFTVPRYLQKFASRMLVSLGNTSRVKRAAYDLAVRIGRACARRRWDGKAGPGTAIMLALARRIAFAPMLRMVGLDRLALVIAGGAPLAPETMTLWQIWGVNVVEAYGQTETAGAFISAQPGPFPQPGNVGTVMRSLEVRLGDKGEILVRGPDLFEHYLGNPETAVLDAEGWLHTGDVGEWQEHNLRIVDRVRDFIVTSGGKTISPSFIENILRASPYVSEAIVFGHARKYLTALIEIDQDAVADWARTRNVPYTGFTSLTQNAEVQRLIGDEIERANREVARVEQIKAFRILPKALDPEEEGEPVTPTRKVKRALMYERFKAFVEDMYDDREEQLIAAGAGAAPKV
jgi:long-chain acyl-CoA synthetase